MPHIEVDKLLKYSCDAIYPFICRMERYPEFMDNVVEVKILERDTCKTITSWKVFVDGIKVGWIEEDLFDEKNYKISYKQIEGDFTNFNGEWILEKTQEGTIVKLIIDVDLGISMLANFINPILIKKISDNSMKMLESIEKELNQKGNEIKMTS